MIQPTLAAAVDRSYYNAGDVIKITINVLSASYNTNLVVVAKDPTGHVPFITTLVINSGGTFTVEIPTGSSDWQRAGLYLIGIQLGVFEMENITFFTYNM